MAYVPRIAVRTDCPVAYDSPDHLVPWGTRRDNSKNPRFNDKIYRLYAALGRPLRVLDLGCSGGGFIRDCINDGCLAVGIEGSDYSKRMARAEWALLADRFLFTADITRPFSVVDSDSGETLQFDVVTSWEVLEHLPADRLPTLVENIRRHLAPGGIFVGSIACDSDIVNGVELHQTMEEKPWWKAMFAGNGLYEVPGTLEYFSGQYIRGPRQEGGGSFNMTLSADQSPGLSMPARTKKDRILDSWYFSRPHRILRQLITFQR